MSHSTTHQRPLRRLTAITLTTLLVFSLVLAPVAFTATTTATTTMASTTDGQFTESFDNESADSGVPEDWEYTDSDTFTTVNITTDTAGDGSQSLYTEGPSSTTAYVRPLTHPYDNKQYGNVSGQIYFHSSSPTDISANSHFVLTSVNESGTRVEIVDLHLNSTGLYQNYPNSNVEITTAVSTDEWVDITISGIDRDDNQFRVEWSSPSSSGSKSGIPYEDNSTGYSAIRLGASGDAKANFDDIAINGVGTVGQVTADGAPVANATIVAEYEGEDFNDTLIDNTPYQELKNDPLTNIDDWHTQQDESGVNGDEIQPSELDVGGTTVLMHSRDEWGLDGPIKLGGRYFPASSTGLDSPDTALAPGDNPTFSCWQPTSSIRGAIFEDELEAEVGGFSHATCEAITIERVDPLNDTVWKTNYSTGAEIAVGLQTFDATSTTYEIAAPDLDEGIYRVYPKGQRGQAMTYVIAPNGDVDRLEAGIENWASDQADANSEYNQRVKDKYSNIPGETVTTNATGYYTLSPPPQAESVDIRVLKSGAEGTVNDPSNLTEGALTQDIETATRDNFDAETSVDFDAAYDAMDSDNTFRSVCERMTPVTDRTGAPFYAEKRGVPLPNGDLDVQGDRTLTQGLDPAERTCANINIVSSLLEDPSSVLPGLPDDLDQLTRQELNKLLGPLLPALRANPELREDVEQGTGITLDSNDPAEYTTDQLKQLASDGTRVIDSGGGGDGGGGAIPTNGDGTGTGGGGVIPDGGSDSPAEDVPSVGDGDSTSNRTNETLSYTWPVANVDNWDETEVLIRISGNGSTDTLGTNSSYVDVDENAAGTDTVTLEEYPVDGNAAAFQVTIDVISPDGIGRDRSQARHPTFDGEIPDLQALRVSARNPGPSDSVTVEAHPEPNAAWGGVQSVEVSGPSCSKTLDATDDEATFSTCGEGDHRVAFIISNGGNATFTEVVRLDAKSTSSQSPAQISAATGSIGRYAIASGGLESGRIEVTDGASVVELTAITPTTSDPPSRVIASTVGVDAARGATTEVEVREGSQERTIRQRIPIVLHTDPVDDETLMWRNGQPIRNPGESPTATVEHENASTVIDTYTGDDATLVVTVDRNPGPFTRLQHNIGLRFPSLPLSAAAGVLALLLIGRKPPRFGSTSPPAGGSQEATA
jgi:hypothetical protein